MVEEIANRVPEQKEHNEKESRRRVDWKISSRKYGPKSTKKAVEETEKKESITKRSVTKENIEGEHIGNKHIERKNIEKRLSKA